MEANVMNPDSTMMKQAEGQWQKFMALAVAKYEKETGKSLKITAADVEELAAEGKVLLTHGHHDSVEFKMVSHEEAVRLMSYDAMQGGRA